MIEVKDDGMTLEFNYPLEGQLKQYQYGYQYGQMSVLVIPSPNKTISVIGHKVINSLCIRVHRETRTLPIEILEYCLKHCPHIRKLVFNAFFIATKFKIFQVDYLGKDNDGCVSSTDESGSLTRDNSLVKVSMNRILFTTALDDLYRCFPNIEILLTTEGSQHFDRNIIPDNINNCIIRFTKLKKLRNLRSISITLY